MMIKQTENINIRLMFLLVIVIVLSGCPPPAQLSIYNNSTSAIHMILKDGSQRSLLPKERMEISDYTKNGIKWEELDEIKSSNDGYNDYFLSILCEMQEYNYRLKNIFEYPASSGKVGNSGIVVTKLQMEADCKLYGISFEEEFPYKDGFFLNPILPM